jgi:hypothetical protein
MDEHGEAGAHAIIADIDHRHVILLISLNCCS